MEIQKQKSIPLGVGKQEAREKIVAFEELLANQPNALFGTEAFPVKHTFVDGAYVREITMPKGTTLTSKIHKIEHPFFVMSGKCSVITDEKVEFIEAPYWGVTKPGTKRILQIHEETVWITVHVTDSKDLEEIEKQIILPEFEKVIEDKKETLWLG